MRTTSVEFQSTERRTRKLLEAKRVSKSMDGKPLFADLDLTLSPGMCLGLVGANGSGKTTLLRLLHGELKPDEGTIEHASNLRIVHFSQHRESLNPTASLRQALCPIGETVHYGNQSIHVAAWAKRFLFDAERLNVAVRDLSGGEQARVLIANLMLQQADVLILDEPTNDLDIPSLEVLEQALSEFPGAIVLVTHDRFMLQRLATHLIALDGRGGVKHYADYEQWNTDQIRERESRKAPEAKKQTPKTFSDPDQPASPPPTRKKLSYKLQRELEGMEQAILDAEEKLSELQRQAGDPSIIADHVRYAEVCRELGEAQGRVQSLYDRWAELESMEG